ncbi:YlbD family protein [Halalkalibacter hemicellulosilyticus]|uniref:Coat protein n=1 Tax=Halalkalibacter hemicellulosilyticusJCM 9152 TaxID=1236971 RepID=W4QAN9_9BACI|nr:YlbD family protein [Halalkalibacter hemicellulosilyticus]GAE29121.1 hypothetical protein JCM9152_462 [Halalkalibacter hemicellulosilyticusJCM 9152]
MSKHGLHPTVRQFKDFMGRNPHLIREVKENNKSLQEVFEEWNVFGEDHDHWNTYAENIEQQEPGQDQEENSGNGETASSLGQIMGLISRLNVNDLQQHLSQFSSVLGNVQNVIQSFQQPNQQQNQRSKDHPFSFRRD